MQPDISGQMHRPHDQIMEEMESNEKHKRRFRWPFCGSSAELDDNASPRIAQVVVPLASRHLKGTGSLSTRRSSGSKIVAATNGSVITTFLSTPDNGKTIQTKSTKSWCLARKRVRKILQLTSTPRTKHTENDDIQKKCNEIKKGSHDGRTRRVIHSSDEVFANHSSGQKSPNKCLDRSRTIPTRAVVVEGVKYERGRKYVGRSPKTLRVNCELDSTLLPRVQSMMTPRQHLSTKGDKVTKKRRGSQLDTGIPMQSLLDEEDEMVGFECIERMGDHLILPSLVAAKTISLGILPVPISSIYQSRQDTSASRSVDNRRESDRVKRPDSALNSKLVTSRKSGRDILPRKRYEMGSFDTFVSAFLSSPVSSSFDEAYTRMSTLDRDLENKRERKKSHTEVKSIQQKSAGGPLEGFTFFYSHSASYSLSSSSSSTSSYEEDDLDSHSMASNSTISTRASDTKIVEESMVMFEPSIIDAGRESDSE